ncbi:hypothetical protein GCM10007972_23920 [Iodidimonas muriae]|uniref:Flagellar biosynthesis regulatory protein FlaF n=1 Tax=Iodidimonas muriae TaxID=261467 RepID=A0ABQ2LFP7_9PROT|nr:flagellar biosynthesis regulator FlaF [Iodidimonas muriae]GER08566.1 hypothetical protein JCM17843_28760 [Kordiimonadales bacterium JCM 17843]GGO15618.1 hypothetical protein GCM10007972_23920 [Iodidimonas muriae]
MYGLMRGGASAYKQTIRETESPRAIERRLFSKVTAALEALVDEQSPFAPDVMRDRNKALADNLELWGVVLFEAADKGNALPQSLRAQLIGLALFVDRITPDIVEGKSSLEPLINLNRSIIKGLEGDGGRAQSVADAALSVAGGFHGA